MSSATRPRRGPRVNYAGQAPLSQSEEDFEESPAQSEESDEEVDSGKLSEELGDDMDLDESGEFGEAGEEMDGEAVEVGQSHRVADGDFAIDQSSKPSAKGSTLVGGRGLDLNRKKRKLDQLDNEDETAHIRLSQKEIGTTIFATEVQIPLSNQTKQINRWLAAKKNLSIIKPLTVTPLPAKPKHITALVPIGSRKHVILRTFRKQFNRQPAWKGKTRTDQRSKDYKVNNVDCWIVIVKDSDPHNRNSQEIALFDFVPGKAYKNRNYSWNGGMLDVRFCATEALARRVGQAACVMLDRLPGSLADFPDRTGRSNVRRLMIECLSLAALSPHFDYMDVDPVWRGPNLSTHIVTNIDWRLFHYSVRKHAGGDHLHFNCYTADAVQQEHEFSPRKFDLTKLANLGKGAPEWFYYKLLPERPGFIPEKEWPLFLELVHHIQYQVWGRIGDRRAIVQFIQSLERPYLKTGSVARAFVGPCEGELGWRYYNSGTRGFIRANAVFTNSVKGKIPDIFIRSRSKVCIAFVLQQGLLAWTGDEGQLGSIEAQAIGVDVVDNLRPHLITKAQILERYCVCDSPEMKAHVMHYCMSCFLLDWCVEFSKAEDGRLLCNECFLKLGTSSMGDVDTSSWLARMISTTTWQALYRESQRTGKAMDKDLLASVRAEATKAIVDLDSGHWKDTWNGVRSLTDAIHGDIAQRSSKAFAKALSHPLQPSLEAPNTLHLADGKVHYHHPGNIGLTALALNFLHASWPPSMLPWIRLARQAWEKELNGAARDDDFWASFNLAMDWTMAIRQCTQREFKKRMAMKISDGQFRELSAMWKSGIPSSPMLRPKFKVASSRTPRDPDEGDIQRVDVIVREAEARFPTHKLPRSESGAPWPFRLEHLPRNWTYNRLFKFFDAHLDIATRLCNSENETNESPENFILACIIWFLKSGGKDELLGCPLTMYSSHPACLAVGRATHVRAGTPMYSGFKVLHPTSLDDYDDAKCSITFEAQAMNWFKSNFDLSQFEILTDLLKSIALQTSWYSAPASNLPPLPFPDTASDEQYLSTDESDSEELALDLELELPGDELTAEEVARLGLESGAAKKPDGQEPDPKRFKDPELPGFQTAKEALAKSGTAAVTATLVPCDEDVQVEDLVPHDHALSGQALFVGDIVGYPRTNGDFRTINGAFVGSFVLDGLVWRVLSQVTTINTQPSQEILAQWESEMYLESVVQIEIGGWVQDFLQGEASGEGNRCMWNAMSSAWSGTQDNSDLIRDRTRDLFQHVLAGTGNVLSPAQSSRLDMYQALRAQNPGLEAGLDTMEMGEADTLQLVADALDAQIFIYAPLNITGPGEVGEWTMYARGPDHGPGRQVHLINWPNARHWTPIFLVDKRMELPSVPDNRRWPVVSRPDLDFGPLQRLRPGALLNIDIRSDRKRGSEAIDDGHLADMTVSGREVEQTKALTANRAGGAARPFDSVAQDHPCYELFLLPRGPGNANRPELYAYAIQGGYFSTMGREYVATWRFVEDGLYVVTAIGSGQIVVYMERDVARDGTESWRRLTEQERNVDRRIDHLWRVWN